MMTGLAGVLGSFASRGSLARGDSRGASFGAGRGARWAVSAAVVFVSVDASAGVPGGLTTSVGLFAALATLLVLKGLSAGVAGNLLPAAGAVLAFMAGAVVIRKIRSAPGVLRPALVSHSPRPLLSAPSQAAQVQLPAAFDRAELLATARQHFVALQAAWDVGDVGTLRALTTPNMLEELCCQLPERGTGPNRTDVVTLHAALLGFEELGSAYLASIEFSGMIREQSDQGAAPFRELWMLARSKDGEARWRLARQQALL